MFLFWIYAVVILGLRGISAKFRINLSVGSNIARHADRGT
jgi:hypothetical protein